MDLKNIKGIYQDLETRALNEKQDVKRLSYLSVLAVMWEAGVGV